MCEKIEKCVCKKSIKNVKKVWKKVCQKGVSKRCVSKSVKKSVSKKVSKKCKNVSKHVFKKCVRKVCWKSVLNYPSLLMSHPPTLRWDNRMTFFLGWPEWETSVRASAHQVLKFLLLHCPVIALWGCYEQKQWKDSLPKHGPRGFMLASNGRRNSPRTKQWWAHSPNTAEGAHHC